MNRGMIFGSVINSAKAVVYLKQITTGHISNDLTLWNPQADNNIIGPCYTKNREADGQHHSVFTLPFRWEAHSLGDFASQARFRIFAMDQQINLTASVTGNIHVEPDWHRIPLDMAVGWMKGGLMKLARQELASAMATAFSPRLATERLWALGLARVELG